VLAQPSCAGALPIEYYGFGSTSTLADRYLVSFYWVLNILMSNSMVHVLPGTPGECLFTMFLQVINLTLLSYVVGQVSNNVMKSEDELRCVAFRVEWNPSPRCEGFRVEPLAPFACELETTFLARV